MAKTKIKSLPPVGSVIAYLLPNKLYTTFRVLRAKTIDGPKYVLAVCSPFISKERPSGITDEMKRNLYPTFHGLKGKKPSLYWVSYPLDSTSLVIGSVTPSKEEKLFERASFGHWLNLQHDALTQWRWDHEREKLLADESAEQTARHERAGRIQAAHDAQMKSMTIEKLAKYKFFPGWENYPPTKVTNASRQLLKAHVAQLITLGTAGSKFQKSAIIKSCVEAFNTLNSQHDDFVDTDIREDIIDEISKIASASGLGEMAKKIDNWRAF